jgi:hypothetical protein
MRDFGERIVDGICGVWKQRTGRYPWLFGAGYFSLPSSSPASYGTVASASFKFSLVLHAQQNANRLRLVPCRTAFIPLQYYDVILIPLELELAVHYVLLSTFELLAMRT